MCVYTYRRLQRCLCCGCARGNFFFFVSFFSFLLFALESFVGGGGGGDGLRLVVFFFFWKLNYSLRLFEVEEFFFFFFSKSEIFYTGVSLSVKFVEISRKEEKEEERE